MLFKRSILGVSVVAFIAFGLMSCNDESATSEKGKVPKIESFKPVSGPVGTSVTIKGHHLANVGIVKFDDAKAPITDQSMTEIDVKVPQGLTADIGYRVTLLTQNKTAAVSDSFKVTKSNCYAQLFDGDHFEDNNIVIEGPGKYKNLADLPNATLNWNGEADSFKAGKTATVTVWAKTNFKGDSTVYKANTAIPSVMKEFSSMKIACQQQ